MKRLVKLLSATLLLALASCQQDSLIPEGGAGNATFKISMPAAQVGTRAFSDGTTATDLAYAIYDANTNNFVSEGTATFQPDELSTTVSINLAQGNSYKIAFFAYNKSQNVYTFDAAGKKITVSYADMTSYNATDYECFYKLENVSVESGGVNREVILNRPVAQVNWGTSDLAEPAVVADNMYGVEARKLVTSVVTKAYTGFDLIESDVIEGTETDVTFPMESRPTGELFPVESDKYSYVSMQYLLMPKAGTLEDIKLQASNAAGGKVLVTVDVPNAPVQANYQTNIYGALLTCPTDFIVTKDKIYSGVNDIPLDAEVIADGVKYDALANTYFIENLNGLTWLRDQSIGDTPNNFQGKKIKLVADIDMSTVDNWTPISYLPSQEIQKHFKGEFDGCGHTISNMTSNSPEGAGLFYNSWGVIKNVILKNVNVTANRDAAGIVGWGHLSHVENCHVIGGTIKATPRQNASGKMDDGNNAGGIAGYLASNNTAYIKNCSVSGVSITAYRKVGGIVGYANVNPNESTEVSGNTVTDCKIVADMTVKNYYEEKQPEAGEIYGGAQTGVVLANNTFENTSVLVLAADNNVNITSPQAFVAVLNLMNSDKSKMAGKTINITGDLDLTNVNLPSIQYFNPEGAYPIIDGNNHTLSNITLTPGQTSIIKLFTGHVRNMKVKGFKGTPGARFSGFIGNLYGTVDNVHFEDVDIKSSEGRVGTIVGIFNGGKISNCSVKNARIVGTWSIGGLVGAANEEAVGFENCTVDNVQAIYGGGGFGGVYNKLVGVMVGDINKTITFTGCKILNCDGKTKPCDYACMPYYWDGELIPADE